MAPSPAAPVASPVGGCSPVLPARVRLIGIELDAVSMPQALDFVVGSIRCGRGGWCVTPNLDIFRRLSRDRSFADLCADATLRLADGMPLIWASRLRGTPLPERVPGSDLIWALSSRAASEGLSVFLLGGNPGTAEAAAGKLRERDPALKVAGTACPPMGFEHDESYLDQLQRQIVIAAPDIVYVALGSPKQELLIRRLREALPAAWFFGIGVSFSFVSGEIRRAPRWMQKLGVEWVHRLVQEPGRLARRYLVDGVPFAALLLCRCFLDRFRRGAAA